MKPALKKYIRSLSQTKDVYLDNKGMHFELFEENYLKLRDREQRLLSDADVSGLPFLRNGKHEKEWAMRARSAKRVSSYFSKKKPYRLLDLGCGNGWFSALMARSDKNLVFGLDANFCELEQAARIFNTNNLFFIQGDIFQMDLPKNSFDYITLNAAIQYFDDMDALLSRLFEILKPLGEVHFIDSPVYTAGEVEAARERSQNYYRSQGFDEMNDFYFHHHWGELKGWEHETLYAPKPRNIFQRLARQPDIPFPWIKISGRK